MFLSHLPKHIRQHSTLHQFISLNSSSQTRTENGTVTYRRCTTQLSKPQLTTHKGSRCASNYGTPKPPLSIGPDLALRIHRLLARVSLIRLWLSLGLCVLRRMLRLTRSSITGLIISVIARVSTSTFTLVLRGSIRTLLRGRRELRLRRGVLRRLSISARVTLGRRGGVRARGGGRVPDGTGSAPRRAAVAALLVLRRGVVALLLLGVWVLRVGRVFGGSRGVGGGVLALGRSTLVRVLLGRLLVVVGRGSGAGEEIVVGHDYC
ncbi:hypothetical protein FPQ18DRAFT_353241, partial [Pyronema domesticum]